MKKYLSIIIIIPLSIFGQGWKNTTSQNNTQKGELTFFDIRKNFDDYWRDYSVNNKGYYKSITGTMKKAPGWKQFNRWAWDMESQINTQTGELPIKSAQQVYDEFVNKSSKNTVINQSDWKSLGPNSSLGGYQGVGRVNCIAFHPTDNNIYWVGAPAGGLWVTYNDGDTWACLTDSNSVLGISDIAIPSDYETSNIIYIATGDKDGWDNNSVGVLKSVDGGLTWDKTGLEYTLSEREMVNRLLIDPTDNNVIIAATSSGVFKTIDGGVVWSTLLTNNNFIDLEYKPSDFNTLYGSVKGDGIVEGKIYKTIDGGTNWVEVFSNNEVFRIELAVVPINSGVVYAVMSNNDDGLFGVYKSEDSGDNFVEKLNGTAINLLGWDADGQDKGGQGWYDLSLAIAPENEDIVIVGGVNSWRSVDGGVSWSIITHWWGEGGVQAVHADKHSLVYRDNGDLFECNDGGIYISTNDGNIFLDRTNGMIISQMYKLGVSAVNKNEIIAGLQDNGTKLLVSGDWFDVKGGDGGECLIDYVNVDIQYASYVYGQISKTINYWITEEEVQPVGAGKGAWITPYLIDPLDNSTLYAGYADVWKTTNKAANWVKISSINSSDKLRSMAICSSNTSVICVADNTHIWRTLDGGGAWVDITNALPVLFSYIKDIAIKYDDANTLWVTLSGYNNDGVYESKDGGVSWTNISDGLPPLPVYSIVQDNQINSTTCLYVGTELGVYFKTGDSVWVEFNKRLPNVKVGELEIYYDSINSDSSVLRCATYGRGLWESPLGKVAPVSAFIANPKEQNIGGSVDFTDISMNSPIQRHWVFEGGTPGVSDEQNPKIVYDTLGTYSVSLIVTNQVGADTLVKDGCVVIIPTEIPIAGFNVDNTYVVASRDVQFVDTSLKVPTSWQWIFEGGEPYLSIEQNPIVRYESEGTYDVKLVVENEEGSDSVIMHDFINVVIVSLSNDKKSEIKVYPNPTSDIVFVELLDYNSEYVAFEIYDLNGKLIKRVIPSVKESTSYQIDVSDISSGDYLLRINVDNDYIVKSIVKK